MLFDLQVQVQWILSLGLLFTVFRLAGVIEFSWLWLLLLGLLLLGPVGIVMFAGLAFIGFCLFLKEVLE